MKGSTGMDEQKKYTTLFQHGTLSLLVPGLFEGTMTVGELLQHGDYGIGTVQDLDGEMVVIAGKAYQVTGSGKINQLKPEQAAPFATVHFNAPHAQTTLKDIDKSALEQHLLEKYPYRNVFFAVKIEGEFAVMHTRAVEAQKKPYPSLTTATKTQPTFDAKNVQGTLIGYYAPALFQGVAVAGYHVHFLSADHQTIGGHVLDYHLKQGQVAIQPFATLQQHFPLDDQAFLKEDFDYGDMDRSINQAEK